MDYQYILYEEQGPVAIITYNRPERRNAWNSGMVLESINAFQRANANDAIRAIVLTGTGTVYCAGADTKTPEPKDAAGRTVSAATYSMGRGEHNWIDLLEKSKPNIIAVNGPAIGIGCTHILSADMRIAAASATFSFPFLRLGAMPEAGSTGLLARIVGFGRALDLVLRSSVINAQEALRIGLVTGVHPDGDLREAAIELARQIAAYPPLQVKLTKGMMYGNAGERSSEEILRRENSAFLELLTTLRRSKTL
jgi:enoyl-CoA hydratase/carnithine racemase